ncbi:beta-ketoacyl-ACP reductase [Cellulomonas chitinilytica]|uniref:Beta-ketoacyl-ACP reductase n=1 Tax=Cellulomonas chitinilytica TaxID=398759 RepID=A0A919P1L2_9CELL|nr:SDR family oxidoreductase [Cellulomonas chitinilytica]GIG21701.1 beta-ketoacyl-ACP reductase [Cellulomonas chitinilytica]
MSAVTTGAAPRVALVSGASRGLGLAVAERLLAAGWSVGTFSRSSTDELDKVLENWPDTFSWTPGDVAKDDMRQHVRTLQERFGPVDALVNNAGVLHQELFLTMPEQRIDELLAVNLAGPARLAQACARQMSVRGRGVILNVSSINSLRGFRGVAAYAAAKAGLDGLTRSLARELGPAGIRVNSLVPGYFETAMTSQVTDENRVRITRRTPLGRLGTTDEIARVATFLLSDEAAFITGQTITVDGGLTC